jgi:hypothetical protein
MLPLFPAGIQLFIFTCDLRIPAQLGCCLCGGICCTRYTGQSLFPGLSNAALGGRSRSAGRQSLFGFMSEGCQSRIPLHEMG